MTTSDWLDEHNLSDLTEELADFGQGHPPAIVRQALDACWAEAKAKGAAPPKLFPYVIKSRGDKVLARLGQGMQGPSDTYHGMPIAEAMRMIEEYRATLSLLDPCDLNMIWYWVDDRTRYADGRTLSEVEPNPLGSPTNIWSIGRAVEMYGVEQLTKFGRGVARRGNVDFEACLDELRKSLDMPELGAILYGENHEGAVRAGAEDGV